MQLVDSSNPAELSARFRRREHAERLALAISKIARGLDDQVKIMDFCGTHEWTITHYGLRSLMPPNVELVAGPGCPVCITPGYFVEAAVRLAMDGVRVFTYGDSYRLQGSLKADLPKSLEEAKLRGGKVEVVYSVLDAVRIAREDGEESVFLAVGFETTAPATLAPVRSGDAPNNLKFINVHRLTPPITRYVLETHPEAPIRGIIAPGHVSAITGAGAWAFLPGEYGIPTVVAGFEPIDVLLAILEILRQVREGKARLVNEYSRVVSWEGNLEAQRLMRETCDVVDAGWRGIGFVPDSGLAFKGGFRRYDALEAYGIPELTPETWERDLPPGCRCAEVTLGMAKPTDCPMFLRACTPESPYGP
ncbi:MAG TPA: hydrogenase formation protein HypD, partial [Candidatus Korarchaeota archaeon]|nr:hydrogenase formation protein HypD [Candidatus Korarchaeota archaeon]